METLLTDNIQSLDDAIINTIISIRENKKRPNESSIYSYIQKHYKNLSVNKNDITNRIISLVVTNKLTDKMANPLYF